MTDALARLMTALADRSRLTRELGHACPERPRGGAKTTPGVIGQERPSPRDQP